MSTTIHVYPTVDALPLVEEIRGRTQELFQTLLNRHGIGSTIEVKALYPSRADIPIKYVEKDVVWTPDLYLTFDYLIDGIWDSASWPRCPFVEDDDRISEEDLVYPFDSKPEHLGLWYIVEEFEDIVPPTRLAKILAQDHYWTDERNFGGPPVASTGYGLVCAALAEATEGIMPHSTPHSTTSTTAKPPRSFLLGGVTGKSISMARTHSEIREGKDTN